MSKCGEQQCVIDENRVLCMYFLGLQCYRVVHNEGKVNEDLVALSGLCTPLLCRLKLSILGKVCCQKGSIATFVSIACCHHLAPHTTRGLQPPHLVIIIG